MENSVWFSVVEHEWGEMSQINFCEIYLDKLYTALGLSAGAFTTNSPAKAWYLKPSLVQLYQSKKTRSLIVILFVLRSHVCRMEDYNSCETKILYFTNHCSPQVTIFTRKCQKIIVTATIEQAIGNCSFFFILVCSFNVQIFLEMLEDSLY